jgi:hypothetical protein
VRYQTQSWDAACGIPTFSFEHRVMDDGRIYFARSESRWLGSLLILFIGLCQWIYAFIFTTLVVMAGGGIARAGAEIEIDFSTPAATLRTSFFFALIGLTWFGTFSFLWRRRWAWYYTWGLGLFLLGIGLYAYSTSQGALEAFLATGSLRQTIGLVIAVLATLMLLPLPPLRRQFFDNSRLSFRERPEPAVTIDIDFR